MKRECSRRDYYLLVSIPHWLNFGERKYENRTNARWKSVQGIFRGKFNTHGCIADFASGPYLDFCETIAILPRAVRSKSFPRPKHNLRTGDD